MAAMTSFDRYVQGAILGIVLMIALQQTGWL